MNSENLASKGDPGETLIVHVLDVGHGDSLVIEFPGRRHVGIVDCHTHRESNRGFTGIPCDPSEPKAFTFLRQEYLEKDIAVSVAFVCLSHFHDDHYMGMARLLAALSENGVEVQEFWDAGISRKKARAKARLLERRPNRKEKAKLRELVDLYGVAKRLRHNGMRYEPLVAPRPRFRRICRTRIDVLAPDAWHWDGYNRFLDVLHPGEHSLLFPASTDEHLASSALLLAYGKGRVILGGDLTCDGWEALLRNRGRRVIRSHAAKVSHHGSTEGNFLPARGGRRGELWQRITYLRRSVAVISGGYRTGLPHRDTLNALRGNAVNVYCTGDFRATVAAPSRSAMSDDAWDVFVSDSLPIMDIPSSYHGNIRIELWPNGKVQTTTETGRPPL